MHDSSLSPIILRGWKPNASLHAAGAFRFMSDRYQTAATHLCGVRALLLTLLLLHICLLAFSAPQHSPTLNEPGHLAAGLSYWQFGKFGLYNVNPPLVRLVAALPALVVGSSTDWSRASERPGLRTEVLVGSDFVAVNGEQSLWLFTLARWACIPFSVIGALACYAWAKSLYGQFGGILAVALWCFDPLILGHGELITSDAAATAIGLVASYTFWRWLRAPEWWRCFCAGAGLGLALLSKTSWLLLVPLWPMLWLAWRFSSDQLNRWRWRQAMQLGSLMLIACYVVNAGYAFEGSCAKLGSFPFVSHSLNDGGGNRFRNQSIGNVMIPLPRHFVLGIDLQKKDFEEYPQQSFLNGEWKDGGWWYYYVYGLAVKAPLGTLALFLFSVGAAWRRREQFRDELVLLAPGLALLLLVSAQTEFNQHVRYVLPTYGALLVFCGGAFARVKRHSLRGVLSLCAIASAMSSMSAYPHCLAYFNEAAGGPRNGRLRMLHSNLDWGQDLLFLQRWLTAHPEYGPPALVYYGYFEPKDVGLHYRMPVRTHLNLSPPFKTDSDAPRVLAVSANFLYGCQFSIAEGRERIPFDSESIAVFRDRKPIGRAGESIYIFAL